MALKPGTRIGPYEITAPIGAGGMGEVYRATDTKLRREVAIKVLPDDFAQDRERLARFEREAHVLASLNHPSIASIYGLEETEGSRCLVLELVEGQTLAEMTKTGPLPVEEALEVCRQVAEGLEAAHEAGVIHRDLKPGNIMVTAGGKAKVLDFGLAKGIEGTAGGESASDLSMSPTVTFGGTQAGVILGTAPYMSPEQARGKALDKRTDIWSFGCVLYECLTGGQTFTGETVTDTLSAILQNDPDWSALPERTPRRVRDLLERCLEKSPRNRLHDMGDARVDLDKSLAAREWTTAGMEAATTLLPAARKPRLRAGAVMAGALLVGAIIGVVLSGALRRDSPTGPVTRLSVLASENLEPLFPSITPDGSTIVFRSRDKNDPGSPFKLYTRRLDRYLERAVEGSAEADFFSISADGQWLAFTAPVSPGSSKRRLMKVPVDASAPPLALTDIPESMETFMWLPGGEILAGQSGDPPSLIRFSESGGVLGEPVEISGVDGITLSSILPGGRSVLGHSWIYGEQAGRLDAVVLDIVTGEAKTLIKNASFPLWTPTGHVLFTRGDTLLAVPFDPGASVGVGDPVTIMDGLWQTNVWTGGWYSLSSNGTLAYSPAGGTPGRRLVTVTREGHLEPWSDVRLDFRFRPVVSPDGKRLAVTVTDPEDVLWEVWGSEVGRPRLRVLADIPRQDCTDPVWTPDSESIAYDCGDAASGGIYIRRFDGTDEPRMLLERESPEISLDAMSFTPDGSSLLVRRTQEGKAEALLLSVQPGPEGEHALKTLLTTEDNPGLPSLSPDGRWIAYHSNQTGKLDVFIRRFQKGGGVGPPIQVSDEGRDPVWSISPDERALELFYKKQGRIMSVEIHAGPTVRVSDPRQLFDWEALRLIQGSMMPDGRAIAIQRGEEEDPGNEIKVVQNWFEELEARLPTR